MTIAVITGLGGPELICGLVRTMAAARTRMILIGAAMGILTEATPNFLFDLENGTIVHLARRFATL
jgi:hypothetical protein